MAGWRLFAEPVSAIYAMNVVNYVKKMKNAIKVIILSAQELAERISSAVTANRPGARIYKRQRLLHFSF